MAIFEFLCSENHVTERFVPLRARPALVRCEHTGCDKIAKFVLSATPTTLRVNDRQAFKRQGH